jgi:hypothetical protein
MNSNFLGIVSIIGACFVCGCDNPDNMRFALHTAADVTKDLASGKDPTKTALNVAGKILDKVADDNASPKVDNNTSPNVDNSLVKTASKAKVSSDKIKAENLETGDDKCARYTYDINGQKHFTNECSTKTEPVIATSVSSSGLEEDKTNVNIENINIDDLISTYETNEINANHLLRDHKVIVAGGIVDDIKDPFSSKELPYLIIHGKDVTHGEVVHVIDPKELPYLIIHGKAKSKVSIEAFFFQVNLSFLYEFNKGEKVVVCGRIAGVENGHIIMLNAQIIKHANLSPPPKNCSPNFTFDTDGHKHFKPECFNRQGDSAIR